MATVNQNNFNNILNNTKIAIDIPIVVSGGIDGAYACLANQIAWGSSTFYNKTIESTEDLLNEIEGKIKSAATPDDEVIGGIITDYLKANDITTEITYTSSEANTNKIITGIEIEATETGNDYQIKYTYYTPSTADYWGVYEAPTVAPNEPVTQE